MSIRRWLNQIRAVTHDALQRPSVTRARATSREVWQLEDRIMFSAAPVEVMPAEGDIDPFATTENLVLPADSSTVFENAAFATNDIQTTHDNTPQGAVREVIFVDTSVENYQQLVDDLLDAPDHVRDFDFYLIDGSEDGVQQITDILADYSDLDAIHVISHGDVGRIQLGDAWLNIDTLGAYADQIAGWNDSLATGADLLFYGCNLARNDDGQTLVDALATLTGADVAASTDLTGTAQLGGDWDLEYTAGSIESAVAFSSNLQANWYSLLGPGGWLYRQRLTFDNSAQTEFLNDFPVLVHLDNTNFDFSQAESNGEDIRFYDADDTTPLKYEIESWDAIAEEANIWVRVPQIDGLSSTDFIWMYYGKAGATDAQDAANVWDTNYGGVWHLHEDATDEQITGTHYDSTANDNDGTQNNNENSTGQIAQGQLLDGSNDYIDVGNGSSVDITGTQITVEAWINANSWASAIWEATVLDNHEWGPNRDGYVLRVGGGSNGEVEFQFGDGGGWHAANSSSANMNTGQWHYLVATYDGSNVEVFVNGNSEDTTSSSAAISSSASNLNIGRNAYSDDRFFDGLIDEVRVSNTARSADWIAAQYAAMSDTFITFGAQQAAVSNDLVSTSEFLVNTETGSNQTTDWGSRGAQRAVAMNSHGDYVVVWSSENQEGPGNWGIYGQRFDRDGNTVGSEFRVANTTSDDQQYANVAIADNGNFVVTWTDDFGGGAGVEARLFQWDLTPITPNDINVNTTTSGDQTHSSVAMDAVGNFVVVWEGNGNEVGHDDNDGVFFRRYDAAGNPLDTNEKRVNEFTLNNQGDASVAMNAGGEFVVVFDDSDGIHFRKFTAGGTPVLQNTVDGSGSAGQGSVAVHDDGSFVVTWRETISGSRGMFAQRYDNTNTAVGSKIPVNTSLPNDQTDPSIDMDEDGNFIIVWEGDGSQPGNVDGAGVFAQRFDASGNRVGNEFLVNQTTSGTQDRASVAMLDLNNYVVAWTGEGPGDTDGVFARQFGTAPSGLWLSTTGATTDNNTPIASWDAFDIMSFGDPNPTFGPGSTSGTFVNQLSFANDIRAMHYVSSETTVQTGGGTPYVLQEGQIVMSFQGVAITLPGAGGTSLNVDNKDVVVYTPWTDEFDLLLDDKVGGNVHAISIVEQQVDIGVDTTLVEGTYLIATSGPSIHDNVYTYVGATAVETPTLLLDGDDAQFGVAGDQIQGLEFLEDNVTLGDTTLAAHTLLITVNFNTTLNGTSGGPQDIFALTINATQQDSTPDTDITAGILFDGSDVGLSGANEEINALTVVQTFNSPPIATDDNGAAFTTDEDTSFTTGNVLDNDIDPDIGDTLGVTSIDATGTLGLVTGNGDGTFNYNPNGQFDGLNSGQTATDTFIYTVSDGRGGTDTATVTITINGADDTPIATDDSGAVFTTDEDTVLNIAVSGVLANDVDPNAVPTGGATLNYIAPADFDGNNSWETTTAVAGFDWDLSGSGTFRSTTPTTALPGIGAAYVFDGVTGGGTTTGFNALPGDPSNNSASFEIWFNPDESDGIGNEVLFETGGISDAASLTLNGATLEFKMISNTGADSQIVSTDISAEIGANEFIQVVGVIDLDVTDPDLYVYVNGSLASSATDIPNLIDWAFADGAGLGQVNGDINTSNTDNYDGEIAIFRLYESALTSAQVLNNYDAVNTVSLAATSLNTTGTLGLVTLNTDGSFAYDPNGQFENLAVGETATDTFTYAASNGNGTDTATVTITITGANDDPTANDDSGVGYATDEDTGFITANVLPNDTDPDLNDTLSVASLDTTGTLGFVIDNGDGTFSYIPNGQFETLNSGDTATDTFIYTVSDGNGGTDTATVTITITGSDDPPIANDDSGAAFTTDEDNVLNVTAPGVLANDANPYAGPTPGATLNYDAALDDGTPIWEETLGVPGFDWNLDPSVLYASPPTILPGITDAFILNGSGGGTMSSSQSIPGDPTGNSASFEIWFKPAVDGDRDLIFETGGSFGGTSLILDGTSLQLTVSEGVDFAFVSTDISAEMAAGEFIQVAGVIDLDDVPGEADVYLYVNGVLVNSDLDNNNVTDWSDGDGAGLGQVNGTVNSLISPGNFEGGITALRLYESILSGSDVMANYNAITTLPIAGLTATNLDTTGTLGLVTLNTDGSFDYDPNGQFETLAAGETATDTFTYAADNGSGTDTATVTITITGANDDPTADHDATSVNEDDGATNITSILLAGDTDPDTNDTLTVTAVNATGTLGSVSLVFGAVSYDPNGQFEYLAAGETATDTFSYTIDDGNGGTDTATVTVTINGANDDPIASSDSGTGFITDEDVSFTTGNVLGNDTDPDLNDTLSVTGINTASTAGLVTDNGDGTFSYDPNGAFNNLAVGETATDTFSYTVSDAGGGTDTAIVTITLNGTNDDPVPNDDSGAAFTTDEDTSFTTGNVLSNDSDPDTTDTLSVASIDTTGTMGLVTDNGNGTFNYDPNGAFDDHAVGETHTDTFTYTVDDGNGGTETATVTILINGLNDPPTANDDSGVGFATDKNTAFTTGDVLTNDGDPDISDALTVTAVDTTGTLGLVTNNGDGTFDYDPNGQFALLPPSTTATDTFIYTIDDGNGGTDTANVTITVTGTNGPPTARNNARAINEDATSPAAGNVIADDDGFGVDSDPDAGNILTVIQLDSETDTTVDVVGTFGTLDWAGDGSYTYTIDNLNPAVQALAPGETLSDVFTYTLSDPFGKIDTASLTITIDGINDVPTANNDSGTAFNAPHDTAITTGNVLTNDSDPDATDILSISSVDTTGTVGTVVDNGDGTFNYTPTTGFSGTDTFGYTVSDGNGGTDTALVTINVAANGTPAADDDTFNIVGTTLSEAAPGVLANDFDPDGDILTASLKIGPTNGTVTLNADGSFDYTPDTGFVGTDTFTYEVNDGFGNKDTAEVSLVVIPAAPPPAPPTLDPPTENNDGDEDSDTENENELPVPTGGDTGSDPPGAEPPPRTQDELGDVGPSLTVEGKVNEDLGEEQSDPLFSFGQFVPDVKAPSATRVVSAISLTSLTIEELNSELAGAFVTALNHLQDELAGDDFVHKAVVGSSVVATTGLTVGYVIWLIRGGVLLTSLLSSMPAWQLMDPLPVLATSFDDDDDEDTLESLIAKGAQHVDEQAAEQETNDKGTEE